MGLTGCVRLCFNFVLLSDQRGRVISGQGQTYFFINTCTQQDPSEPRDPSHKTTKPLHVCRDVCVWEHDDKQGFFFPSVSFRCHMMQIKRRLALNVPRLECLPLTRAPGKNSHVVSAAAHTHAHTNAHPNLPFMVI